MKKQNNGKKNETNFLTLNKVRNKWTKTEEYKKLDELEKRKRDEFLSEMRNYFTDEAMYKVPIHCLENDFFCFLCGDTVRYEKYEKIMNEFISYINYKLVQRNEQEIRPFVRDVPVRIKESNYVKVSKHTTQKGETNDKK